MAEQRTGLALGGGLSCTLDTTKGHPEHYLTILGGAQPLPLDKAQTLALFKVMLNHLGQLAADELRKDHLLQQVHLVQTFHRSIDWLAGWSQRELEEPELLNEAHEYYQRTYALQEEMLDAINGWQLTLEHEYSKLEEAAEEGGLALEELDEREDEEDLL